MANHFIIPGSKILKVRPQNHKNLGNHHFCHAYTPVGAVEVFVTDKLFDCDFFHSAGRQRLFESWKQSLIFNPTLINDVMTEVLILLQ